ncbi:MAG: helix-turn-helix domain-containing protein [Candidatus Scatosoma sp.]
MPEMLPVRIAFNELTLLLSGSIEYSFNGEKVLLKSGDAVFGRINSVRTRKKLSSCDYVSFNFISDTENETFDLPLYIENGITPAIKLLLSSCDEICPRLQNENEEQLTLLLRCILLQLQKTRNASAYGALTQNIINFVHGHLAEKITLDDVSRATFFSPVHCCVVFNRETGKTITDYILNEKIKEAKNLISQGYRLKDVAERVGMSDYNYFSRLFRKKVGYTPLQYRKFTQA